MPEHLTQIVASKAPLNFMWEAKSEIDSYEVTAINFQGMKSSCSVGQSNSQATCEGLSPCTEYNISVRACNMKGGCGEPAILTVTSSPGRKFRHLFSYFWAVLRASDPWLVLAQFSCELLT